MSARSVTSPALTHPDITAVAKKAVHPDNLIRVVMGNRSAIEKGVRSLCYGKVKVIDAEGNPVE